MSFIVSVIIAKQNFSANLIYLSFSKFCLSSEYVLKQKFKPKYA